jgi:hypothetical protein
LACPVLFLRRGPGHADGEVIFTAHGEPGGPADGQKPDRRGGSTLKIVVGGLLFKSILQPLFIGVVGRTMYTDQKRTEALVMDSGLDWTIVRPSGLFATPAVTRYQVAERRIPGRFTSRADLADCMLQQLTSDQYLHKAVAVATSSGQPSLLAFVWREGIRKKT